MGMSDPTVVILFPLFWCVFASFLYPCLGGVVRGLIFCLFLQMLRHLPRTTVFTVYSVHPDFVGMCFFNAVPHDFPSCLSMRFQTQ